MNDSGNGGSNLNGFILGALVGAGLALMYAPCSGKETRQWLAKKSKELKDNAESVYEDTKETLSREARNLVGEAKDIAKAHGMPSYSGASNKGRA